MILSSSWIYDTRAGKLPFNRIQLGDNKTDDELRMQGRKVYYRILGINPIIIFTSSYYQIKVYDPFEKILIFGFSFGNNSGYSRKLGYRKRYEFEMNYLCMSSYLDIVLDCTAEEDFYGKRVAVRYERIVE